MDKIKRPLAILISLIFSSIGCLVFVYWVLTPQISIRKKPTSSKAFQVDSVVGLRWQISDKEFKFFRQDRYQGWEPKDFESVSIEQRLQAISTFAYESIPPLKRPLAEIEISFGPNYTWLAKWDGEYFRWETGSFEGKGKKLLASDQKYFESGQFSFSEKKYNWCLSSINKIELNFEGVNWRYVRKSGKWTSNNKFLKSSNLIKNWIDTYCTVTVDEYIDLKLHRPVIQMDIKTLVVEFDNGDSITWSVPAPTTFLSGERGFYSNHLDGALAKIFPWDPSRL